MPVNIAPGAKVEQCFPLHCVCIVWLFCRCDSWCHLPAAQLMPDQTDTKDPWKICQISELWQIIKNESNFKCHKRPYINFTGVPTPTLKVSLHSFHIFLYTHFKNIPTHKSQVSLHSIRSTPTLTKCPYTRFTSVLTLYECPTFSSHNLHSLHKRPYTHPTTVPKFT
jgi:hypothetical protein